MEQKRQISIKVAILTLIIMIVGMGYWLIGKCEIWVASLLENKKVEEEVKEEG